MIALAVFCIWSMASSRSSDEIDDVAAVEGRDESAPDPDQENFAGDGIGVIFMGNDAAAGFRHAGAPLQEIAQRQRALHQDAGMVVEKSEEFFLARHQRREKPQHASPKD